MKSAEVGSWEVIFKAIADTAFRSKPVIVLGEFRYIGRANPAFPSVFQRIWEQTLKSKSVMVILCGSLISVMEAQTLAYSSPLYGRRIRLYAGAKSTCISAKRSFVARRSRVTQPPTHEKRIPAA